MDKIIADFGYVFHFPFRDSDMRRHLRVVNAISDRVSPNGGIISHVRRAHDLVGRRSINIQQARDGPDHDIVRQTHDFYQLAD
jgi:hypothetical protein